jgi:hypothetical protein
MGYSLAWLAVQWKSPAIIHQQLGLSASGDFCDYGNAPVVGRQLPSGWYVIVVKGCDHKLISDVVVQKISLACSVIACSIEEHVMFSSAAQWSDGQREWAIQHRGGDYGSADLSFEGDPPPLFAELREHYGSRQNAEGEGKRGRSAFKFVGDEQSLDSNLICIWVSFAMRSTRGACRYDQMILS